MFYVSSFIHFYCYYSIVEIYHNLLYYWWKLGLLSVWDYITMLLWTLLHMSPCTYVYVFPLGMYIWVQLPVCIVCIISTLVDNAKLCSKEENSIYAYNNFTTNTGIIWFLDVILLLSKTMEMEFIFYITLYQATLQNYLINSKNLSVLFVHCYVHNYIMMLGLPFREIKKCHSLKWSRQNPKILSW